MTGMQCFIWINFNTRRECMTEIQKEALKERKKCVGLGIMCPHGTIQTPCLREDYFDIVSMWDYEDTLSVWDYSDTVSAWGLFGHCVHVGLCGHGVHVGLSRYGVE